ncbi:hypothetical protein [Desulfolithobacter sp.]
MADTPYQFRDVMEGSGMSERELLLHGIEGRLEFCVSLHDVTVEWYARYHYREKVPAVSNRDMLRMIREGIDTHSHDPKERFELEEPWSQKDIRGRELLPVTTQTLIGILHEGSAELQLAVPDNPHRIEPDPPPDEIVSFICPYKDGRAAGTLDQYRYCDTTSLLIRADEAERIISEAEIDGELFDMVVEKIELERSRGELACTRPMTPTDCINQRDQLKQLTEEIAQIRDKIDRKEPLVIEPEPLRKNEHAKAETKGNYFKFQGDFWSIRYNGKEVHVKSIKGIRAIAERLKYPGVEKQFISFCQAEDHEPATLKPGQEYQNCYEAIDDKMKKNLEERSRKLHDRLEKALPNTEEETEMQSQIAKLKELLRTKYNAVLLDDGSIKWGKLFDKSDLKRQKNTHHNQLKRGIETIRESHEELAEHLEKYLLKNKFYTSPPGHPEWEIVY